jgi:hypothetical protein
LKFIRTLDDGNHEKDIGEIINLESKGLVRFETANTCGNQQPVMYFKKQEK